MKRKNREASIWKPKLRELAVDTFSVPFRPHNLVHEDMRILTCSSFSLFAGRLSRFMAASKILGEETAGGGAGGDAAGASANEAGGAGGGEWGKGKGWGG